MVAAWERFYSRLLHRRCCLGPIQSSPATYNPLAHAIKINWSIVDSGEAMRKNQLQVSAARWQHWYQYRKQYLI